jgi:hypothetical protein
MERCWGWRRGQWGVVLLALGADVVMCVYVCDVRVFAREIMSLVGLYDGQRKKAEVKWTQQVEEK